MKNKIKKNLPLFIGIILIAFLGIVLGFKVLNSKSIDSNTAASSSIENGKEAGSNKSESITKDEDNSNSEVREDSKVKEKEALKDTSKNESSESQSQDNSDNKATAKDSKTTSKVDSNNNENKNNTTDKNNTVDKNKGETSSDKVESKPETSNNKFVYLTIDCKTILNNMDEVADNKKNIIPKNGMIYGRKKVEIKEGDSVFDVLAKETRRNRIHFDFVETPAYGSAYIKGIANIYEFDAGNESGWMYSVNGVFPNYGVSKYKLKSGDEIRLRYTCKLGKDL